MTREKWKLTQAAIGEPEIDVWGDGETGRGYSLLALLAADPDNQLQPLAPGVYYCEKRVGETGNSGT